METSLNGSYIRTIPPFRAWCSRTRDYAKTLTMNTDEIDTLQSRLLLMILCSAILSSLQPDFKFSSTTFYVSVYTALSLWNVVGTVYMGLRVVDHFRRRLEMGWFYVMKVLETLLWVLPIFLIGFEGGLLAKRWVFGKQFVLLKMV
jgi:hypothetical protein